MPQCVSTETLRPTRSLGGAAIARRNRCDWLRVVKTPNSFGILVAGWSIGESSPMDLVGAGETTMEPGSSTIRKISTCVVGGVATKRGKRERKRSFDGKHRNLICDPTLQTLRATPVDLKITRPQFKHHTGGSTIGEGEDTTISSRGDHQNTPFRG